jgi:hypothetical protein
MKKVTRKYEMERVLFSDIDAGKCYGVDNIGTYNNEKGFISRKSIGSGYEVKSSYGLTLGNCYGFKGNTLADIIENILNGGFSVYEFDTSQEIFKWLSE